MRIMTYNVRRCIGTDALLSPDRIAEVIAGADADVVCLQELDAGQLRTGWLNQAEEIARRLSMKCEFHPAMETGTELYGDAILSRHPMRIERAGILPWPRSLLAFEPRGALWVSLFAEGSEWQIMNTHLGLGRAERRMQAEALASSEWIGTAAQRPPLVVCGDLNSRPSSKVHGILARDVIDAQKLAGGRRAKTFSTRMPLICLDYIYVTPDVHVAGVHVMKTPLARVASDHFPLIAELLAAA